jgi:hypothetical protein
VCWQQAVSDHCTHKAVSLRPLCARCCALFRSSCCWQLLTSWQQMGSQCQRGCGSGRAALAPQQQMWCAQPAKQQGQQQRRLHSSRALRLAVRQQQPPRQLQYYWRRLGSLRPQPSCRSCQLIQPHQHRQQGRPVPAAASGHQQRVSGSSSTSRGRRSSGGSSSERMQRHRARVPWQQAGLQLSCRLCRSWWCCRMLRSSALQTWRTAAALLAWQTVLLGTGGFCARAAGCAARVSWCASRVLVWHPCGII